MIDRKTLRNFMQNVMREKLFYSQEFTREEICSLFVNYTKRERGLDGEIELISSILDFDFVMTSCEDNRCLVFNLDPVDREDWDESMNKIYTED